MNGEWENRIICGDSIEKLKELPDGIADCCITSPPYYGLRDYGTGKWVGGDPNCDHSSAKLSTRFERTMTETSSKQMTNLGSDVKEYMRVCPVCGAVREDRQIGLEETPDAYIAKLVSVFREVKRVLKDDGTLWVNIGDSYAGSGKGRNGDGTASVDPNSKQATSLGTINGNLKKSNAGEAKAKDLIGIPWMLAFALRKDGWYLRQDIIWHKPNPMPESVKDRCTKSHEYIFLLSKQPNYYFDYEAIQEDAICKDDRRYGEGRIAYDGKRMEGGVSNTKAQQSFVTNSDKRNKRDVWSITTKAVKEAHFATFPEELIKPCILAGCRLGGVVLDPFFGSGTTGRVAREYGRNYIGIELNPEYVKMASHRAVEVQLSIFGMNNL